MDTWDEPDDALDEYLAALEYAAMRGLTFTGDQLSNGRPHAYETFPDAHRAHRHFPLREVAEEFGVDLDDDDDE